MQGALGFWFSAFFGYFGAEYLRWGTSFSTFWGSLPPVLPGHNPRLWACLNMPVIVGAQFAHAFGSGTQSSVCKRSYQQAQYEALLATATSAAYWQNLCGVHQLSLA